MKDIDYYLDPEHAEEWEKLTEEEQAAIYTGSATEENQEPAPESEEEPTEEKPAGIQAKNGKDIIPFSRLEEQTEKAKAAEAKIADLQQTISQQSEMLKALQQAEEKPAEERKESVVSVLDKYEGEYPELVEDLRPLLESSISSVVATLREEINGLKNQLQETNSKVARSESEQEAERAAEWNRTLEEFWADKKNDVFRKDVNPGLFNMLDATVKALAQEDVSFDTPIQYMEEGVRRVKESFPSFSALFEVTNPALNVKEKAEEKISAVSRKHPVSLSDAPGSTSIHHDETEAMLQMSFSEAERNFANLTPDQIDERLSRVL